jgi:hypothetical protein
VENLRDSWARGTLELVKTTCLRHIYLFGTAAELRDRSPYTFLLGNIVSIENN